MAISKNTYSHYSIFIILFMLLFAILYQPVSLHAQGRDRPQRRFQNHKEAIESRRISYITKTLELSTEQAQEFWPIYHEYKRKVDSLTNAMRQKREELPDAENMSEEQAAQYIEAELTRFERSAALRREYTEKKLEVLSVKQVALLFEAEREFNRMIFREAQRQHRRNDRDNSGN